MHAVIVDDLEAYLSGLLPLSARGRFEAHLQACGKCRGEVQEIQESAALLASLKPVSPAAPPPSFVAQVMGTLAERETPSLWALFGDFAFGRRVAFASLLTLAVLGTVLVSREQAEAPNPTTPQALMADTTDSPNAGQMLVTLASYEP